MAILLKVGDEKKDVGVLCAAFIITLVIIHYITTSWLYILTHNYLLLFSRCCFSFPLLRLLQFLGSVLQFPGVDMQAQDELWGFNDRRHRALIMKGKRTKRRRSSSSFGHVTVTSSSSSGGGVDCGGEEKEYDSISSSPTMSGDRIYESIDEEEEMANCLIMLAQSDGPKRSDEFYVHECKSCNRSFPSFQALGGHMASHKKPKGAMTEHKKPLVLSVDDDADIALRVSNKKGNKIHECSICSSEFTSGQALGGHMRRHRAAAASDRSAMNVDRISLNTSSDSNKILLDLNLPAPEDGLRDSQFQFGTPQPAIVFSSPALVDFHY